MSTTSRNGSGLPPRPTLDPGNILLSPRTRRRQRGRETRVLDNVTTASTLTNPPAITPELLSTINAMMGPPAAGRTGAAFRMNPSPDEMVIRQRGRREPMPITFSPDVLTTTQRMAQRQRHPQQGDRGGGGMTSRLLLPTRSSPRKRLTLGDEHMTTTVAANLSTPPKSTTSASSIMQMTPSPDKAKKTSPISKKLRMDKAKEASLSPLVSAKGLSHSQLIDLLGKLVEEQPSLGDRVEQLLPAPDLSPMEETLACLKKNIFKTLPSTRLESRTDSMAYNR